MPRHQGPCALTCFENGSIDNFGLFVYSSCVNSAQVGQLEAQQ